MHAELCPVCGGKGRVEDYGSTGGTIACHGCHGLGWVCVPGVPDDPASVFAPASPGYVFEGPGYTDPNPTT